MILPTDLLFLLNSTNRADASILIFNLYMDNELKQKIDNNCKLEHFGRRKNGYSYSVKFSKNSDGLVKITADNSEFTHQLKELPELYAPEKDLIFEINWDDEYYISLLNTIESGIRHIDSSNTGLTDTKVIFSLEELVSKPDSKIDDLIVREINQRLRYQLSTSDYTRKEVRRALSKILRSVKRHNRTGGVRGYLDFIRHFIS